jgi:hypothetical protein
MRKYSKACKLPSCELNKQDVRTLAELVTRSATSDIDKTSAFFQMSTELKDGEVKAHSVDEFLQENLPGTLTNLVVYCGTMVPDRDVTVRIGQFGGNRLSVQGTGQGWVFGQYELLRVFLVSKRAWVRPTLKRALFCLNTFVSLPLAAGSIIVDLVSKPPYKASLPAASSIFLVFTIAVAIGVFLTTKMANNRIILQPKARLFTSTSIMVIFTVLSGIGGIGGFIAALAALHK